MQPNNNFQPNTRPPDPQIMAPGPRGAILDHSGTNPENSRKSHQVRPGSPNILVHFWPSGAKPPPPAAPPRDSLPGEPVKTPFRPTRGPIRPKTIFLGWSGFGATNDFQALRKKSGAATDFQALRRISGAAKDFRRFEATHVLRGWRSFFFFRKNAHPGKK